MGVTDYFLMELAPPHSMKSTPGTMDWQVVNPVNKLENLSKLFV